MTKKNNEPAFPLPWRPAMGFDAATMQGITKRELIAALLLQGMNAANISNGDQQAIGDDEMIGPAIRQTDALLAELERTSTPSS